MNIYSIALFFHVVGALGLFVAIGLEWANLRQLQRATTAEQVRENLAESKAMRSIGGISLLMLLAAGFYMTFAAWGGADWIEVAFGALVIIGVLEGVLTGPRMRAIQRGIMTEEGSLSPALQRVLHHPLLWLSLQTRTGIALGIVFLMCVKPAVIGSLLAVGVGAIVGLIAAIPAMGRSRQQEMVA